MKALKFIIPSWVYFIFANFFLTLGVLILGMQVKLALVQYSALYSIIISFNNFEPKTVTVAVLGVTLSASMVQFFVGAWLSFTQAKTNAALGN